jgi:predicted integral membrane protein DUF2269
VPAIVLVPLLLTHIALAISLFVPSVLLPFALRPQGWNGRGGATLGDTGRSRFVRGLLWLQAKGTVPLGIGLGLTGLALVALLGVSLLRQPWLLVALAIYAIDLALAFFVQRPAFRRLAMQRRRSDDPAALTGARRQRYLSYLMAGLIGTIGFLMSTKPALW